MANLRRSKFGRTAETLDAQQRALFEEAIDEDLAAVEAQLDAVGPKKPSQEKRQPKEPPYPSRPRVCRAAFACAWYRTQRQKKLAIVFRQSLAD